ncbi:MAG: hypothetical protein QME51_09475, partial [Planctomycetota bacterium]|nr:hypothetical protein [Planctomycetota bacterium]
MNVKCRDKAGNWQLIYSTATNVKADFDNPTAVVTLPSEDVEYDNLATISGTVYDAYPGQPRYIYLQIRGRNIGSDNDPGKIAGPGEYAVTHTWDDITNAWRPIGEGQFWIPIASVTILGSATWYFDNADSVNKCNQIWSLAGNQKWIDIVVYAEDFAGNKPSAPGLDADGRDFKYNVPAPETTISKPAYGDPHGHTNADYWASKLLQGGRSVYTPAVYVSIKRDSDAYYWHGSSFSTPSGVENWLAADLPADGEWNYDFTGSWVDGSTYTVRSRGVGAGGDAVNPQSHRFLYDTTRPLSGIVLPSHNLYYRGLITLSGTASDQSPGAGLTGETEEVKIAAHRLADNHYWNVLQSSWQAGGATPVEANYSTTSFSAGVWQMAIPSPIWDDGKKYRIWSRAKDKAANLQDSAVLGQNDFFFDISIPTATILEPVNEEFRSQLLTISGTAIDTDPDGGGPLFAGKLDVVEIQIKKNTTPIRYWTWTGTAWDWVVPVSWATSTVHLPGTVSSSWTFVNIPSWGHNISYTTLAKAKDIALPAGNTQQVFVVPTSSLSFVSDNQSPDTAITTISDGNRLNPSSPWAIFGTASDSPAGTVVSRIRLQLTRLQDGDTYYWNSVAQEWSSTTVYEFQPDAYGGTDWDYTISDLGLFPSDKNYRIR